MTKLVLDTVTSGFRSGELVTSNNTATIKAIENTLSRDGTSPNFMQAQLDMNGFNIINQGNPVTVQGFDWQGSWITGTTYQDGMVVEFSGSAYMALLTHTAGVFATDLGNGNWQLVASASLPSQAGATSGILRSDGFTASWLQSTPYMFTVLGSVDGPAARAILGTYDGADAVKLTSTQTIAGDKTFTGSIRPSQTKGLTGTTTDNSADPGSIGEVIESTVYQASAVSLTTNTFVNVTSITLTPGDWDIYGSAMFSFGATTNMTDYQASVSTVSATVSDIYRFAIKYGTGIVPGAGTQLGNSIPTNRVSILSNTTYYLVAWGVFTVSTLKAYGRIWARRAR